METLWHIGHALFQCLVSCTGASPVASFLGMMNWDSPVLRNSLSTATVLIQSWDKQLETGLNFCSAPFRRHTFLAFLFRVTGDIWWPKVCAFDLTFLPASKVPFWMWKTSSKTRQKNPWFFSWFTHGFTDSVHKTADSLRLLGSWRVVMLCDGLCLQPTSHGLTHWISCGNSRIFEFNQFSDWCDWCFLVYTVHSS